MFLTLIEENSYIKDMYAKKQNKFLQIDNCVEKRYLISSQSLWS